MLYDRMYNVPQNLTPGVHYPAQNQITWLVFHNMAYLASNDISLLLLWAYLFQFCQC